MTRPGLTYHPALKHALAFACGIALARLVNVPPDVLLSCLTLSLLWLAVAVFNDRLFLSGAVLAVVVLSGGLWFSMRSDSGLPSVRDIETRNVELIGTVASDPVAKDGYVEWRLRPDSILYRNTAARLSGHVVVRLFDSTAMASTVAPYGSKMTLKGTFRLPSGPRYPGEFDHGGWLASRGIAGTFDCGRKSEVHVFGKADEGLIAKCVRRVRSHVKRFTAARVGGEEGDILTALLLGDRADIDRSTREAFALTGASHVLAVSGLHVGIIALGLFVFVSWFRNRWVRFALFTAILGACTILVGSPPSVLRASIMALVFLLAYNTGRISRPLNTLGVAALVLLVMEPGWLFDPGFQLSFAAVAGIVMLYIPMFRMIVDRFSRVMSVHLLRRATQLLLVSVSAQLFTFPLTLHYFGYVSLLSPAVNVFVVPLITAGLGAGVAGATSSGLPFLPEWFGASAWLAIRGALRVVEWSGAFEGTGLRTVAIGGPVSFLMLAGIAWLALSRSAWQTGVRIVSVSLLLLLLPALDRRLDPLAGSRSGYVYLIPISRGGGIVTAVHREEMLTLYYAGLNERDSASADRIGGAVAKRLGADSIRIVDFASGVPLAKDSDLHPVNRAGPEFQSTFVPVLFSCTDRRPPGFVRAADRPFAQIPSHGTIDRAIVLDPWPEWRVVDWSPED